MYVADFETTTDINDCRVWLWGLRDIYTKEFYHGTTIEEFFNFVTQLKITKLFFHNLKFDGEFNFYHLFRNGFKHSREKELSNGEFSTLIDDMGNFYSMRVKIKDLIIEIVDSLKIIPLPVKDISKAFGIKQLKGEIDYTKERKKGYKPDQHEIDYVKNDVEIVAEALKYFFDNGLTRMTQAGNAFSDYKKVVGKKFNEWFPSLEAIDGELRQSYKGGWTYANPLTQGKRIKEGIVLDVNSLYPWAMYTCKLPYGEPIFYKGLYKKDKIYDIFIQCFRCNFELKEGKLPTVQLKNNSKFVETEYLTSSEGNDITLYMTNVDMELFFENYNVYNIEYFHGWKFKSSTNLFKAYIDKWIEIKNKATIEKNEGMRTIAKRMLNALYGKFGLNPEIVSKYPTWDGEYVKYEKTETEHRAPIYIPIASFVTSYARQKTITSAQQVFERFLYADTDSLHLKGLEMPDLWIDDVELGAWKYEGKFKRAKYLRAKSYIEDMFITQEEYDKLKDEKKIKWKKEKDYYTSLQVVCAGLPKKAAEHVTFQNFKFGLVVKGKLENKRVKGGVVLLEKEFTLKLK